MIAPSHAVIPRTNTDASIWFHRQAAAVVLLRRLTHF
jgi:hypothetical protein